jgi:prophage tail gpP-like protein
MADLSLFVAGYRLDSWTSVQVTRSIDALADTFDLSVTQNRLPDEVQEIQAGQDCKIFYGDELLITGYVDEVSLSDNATSSSLSITGRSLAGDLVDCSAVHPQWRNVDGLQIARDLCAPFGIEVSVDPSVGSLAREQHFKVEEGQTVAEVLAHLGELHAARVLSQPDGSLVFTRTGHLVYPDVVIQRGVNVVSARVQHSMKDRYSVYVCKSQTSADWEGNKHTLKKSVRDEGVPRYRPLVLDLKTTHRTEGGSSKSALEEAALWERQTRAGRCQTLEYDVASSPDTSASWETPRGVWRPNTIVTVRDHRYGIDGLYLVTNVTLLHDSSGTRTSLVLTHREAYDVKLPPKPKKKKGGYTW